MKFAVLLLLVSTPVYAESITTNVALELRLLDIKDTLTWTSDVHLRTAALHEDTSGWAATGETATARNLLTERYSDGVYTYEFDLRRLSDRCGRVQLDLESVAWGALAGGVGAYTVIDLGSDCESGHPNGMVASGQRIVIQDYPRGTDTTTVSPDDEACQALGKNCPPTTLPQPVPEPVGMGVFGLGLLFVVRYLRGRRTDEKTIN